jgi:hypothetical protein
MYGKNIGISCATKIGVLQSGAIKTDFFGTLGVSTLIGEIAF